MTNIKSILERKAVLAGSIHYVAVSLVASGLALSLSLGTVERVSGASWSLLTFGFIWPFAVYVELFDRAPGPLWSGLVIGTAVTLFFLVARFTRRSTT